MYEERDVNFKYLSLSHYFVNSAKYSDENLQLLTRPPYKTWLPPIDLVHPGTRLSKSRSRRDDQPPRPQNSFIIFKKDFDARRRCILSDTKVDSKVMCKLAACIWHSDEGLKKYFNLLAKLASQIHKDLYPDRMKAKRKDVVRNGEIASGADDFTKTSTIGTGCDTSAQAFVNKKL
ncbi:3758_t:CDS:2 [Paraglomus occultum]|uniref:3758_t:CDS:1 n=1 Tax=Paraglomus occultum TaxID=144539 RepID=A0A9N9B6C6_9GLOM|nr:3758_t:CDS:2 [Paraglomus occultum]